MPRFGARYGTQASRINDALTRTAETPSTIAYRIGEPVANVSNQLSWLFQRGFIGRNRTAYGRERFAYYLVDAPVGLTNPALRTYGIELEMLIPGVSLIEAENSLISAMQAAGIECRFAGYTHSTTRYWKMVTDASVRNTLPGYYAIELVSPVLKGEEGEEEIREVSVVLMTLGVKVNATCGFHVHHGNEGYDEAKKRQLYRTYGQLEGFIDSIMPPSRRTGNMFCRSCRDCTYGTTRYTKLNASMNERNHRTIEFRQHSGTIEATKIIAWIHLTRAMMNHNDLDALGRSPTFNEMLDSLGLSAEDIRYFLNRRARLNRQPIAA